MITISVDVQSNKGIVRPNNEDMVLVSSKMVRDSFMMTKVLLNAKERYILAVADGMGGHQSGEVASEIVAFDLAAYFKSLPNHLSSMEIQSRFQHWIKEEHIQLLDKGLEDQKYVGMGTTLVVLVVYEGKIFWMNCGDSRIYRFRNGCLVQLSNDHSLENMTGRKGHANIICNSIGAGESSYFDIEDITSCVFNHDTFMLCSDGLSNMLSNDELENGLNNHLHAEDFVGLACKAGGTDNISICLAQFEMK